MHCIRRANRQPILFALLLVLAMGMGGCALPQHVEHYFYEKDGAVVAEAWRYAGNPENPVHRLWINLKSSPMFDIRLPDGVWISSRDAAFGGLDQHGLEVAKIGDTDHAIWHPAFTPGALVGRHSFMNFYDNATRLELGACGWSIEELVRTADKRCAFGFPATLKDLECLLGAPSKVTSIGLVTGHSCF